MKPHRTAAFVSAAFCVALPYSLSAHEGHIHAEAPGGGSDDIGGIIKVTEQGKRNLGIQVVEAEIVEIEKTTEAIAEIIAIPSRIAVLSSRIPGKVTHIHALAGQPVTAGKPLVKIESFQPGDPPPSISYPAPISGTITHWDAEVGESVEPNGHLAEVIDLSEVFAEITLFEGQVNQVKIGQPVRVYVESFPGKSFASSIELLSGKLDPQSRVLKAYARIKNSDRKLLPHMRGSAHVVTEKLDTVIAVPHRAITGDPANLYVFVQTDEAGLEYEQRRIVSGASDDRVTEVIEGVLPGEMVVVSGNYQLQFVETRSTEPKDGEHDHDHSTGKSALAHGPHDTAHPHRHDHGFGTILLAALACSIAMNILFIFRQRKSAAS